MALGILQARQEAIPPPLQQSLIDLTVRIGLQEESKNYQQRFHLTPSEHYSNRQFIFSFDGVVTQMQQAKSMLLWSVDDVYLSVALPKFPRSNYVISPSYIHSQNGEIATQPIENIESRARDDLQARMPAITAMALARAGVKYQTVKELNKKDNVLGAFANVLTIVSEVADLRHWSMLPSSIQIATSYETATTLQLSSRYGQQILNVATNGQQKEKINETEIIASTLTNNSTNNNTTEKRTSDYELSTEENIEEVISRQHITKSMTAKAKALNEDISKVSPATVNKTSKTIAKINNSVKKNAVILLSSLTNKIHIASF